MFFIGRLNAGDPETPDGMIDELRISNVARSQEKIKEAMDAERPKFTEGAKANGVEAKKASEVFENLTPEIIDFMLKM